MCDSKELIVGYVYDELSPAERKALEAHLAGCAECRHEMEGLQATRVHLGLWSPPEPDLGFRVIRGGSAPAPALPRRMRLAPAFAYAAAAALVLATSVAIANVEVRYVNDGVVVRTGWARAESAPPQLPEDAATSPQSAAVTAPSSGAETTDFAELERRLGQLESLMSRPPAGGLQSASASMRMSDGEMLRRVREIVREAESRQETAVAHQLLQVMRDFDQKRISDMAVIQQGLDQYQGLTNAEIAQNRDMFNQLVRAAARQEK